MRESITVRRKCEYGVFQITSQSRRQTDRQTFWGNNLVLFISIFPWNTQKIHTIDLLIVSQTQIISEVSFKK